MGNRAFPRIARHLNYTRQFPAPGKSLVHIPALPYEAFDASGTMVKPQSLLLFFESVRAFTFWKNKNVQFPNQSMCDMQKLLLNHLVFIVGARVNIQKTLYRDDLAKYPLYVETSLTQVGKSSKTLTYKLRNAKTDMLFASCDIVDVLVDEATRKPTSYPEWWLEKYQSVCDVRNANIPEVRRPGSRSHFSTVGVSFSDTDTYKHTNWAAYIKYCYDGLRQNIADGHFPGIAPCVENGGIKSFEMAYKQESNMGDLLDVVSWEEETDKRSVYFNINKGNTLCFGCKMEFYALDEADIRSQL